MSLWNGHPPLNDKRLLVRVARYATEHLGLVVTSTSDGVHAPNSFHYQRRAFDLGLPEKLVGTRRGKRRLVNGQKKILQHFGPEAFEELFGPRNDLCVRGGFKTHITGALALQHDNHIHAAH